MIGSMSVARITPKKLQSPTSIDRYVHLGRHISPLRRAPSVLRPRGEPADPTRQFAHPVGGAPAVGRRRFGVAQLRLVRFAARLNILVRKRRLVGHRSDHLVGQRVEDPLRATAVAHLGKGASSPSATMRHRSAERW